MSGSASSQRRGGEASGPRSGSWPGEHLETIGVARINADVVGDEAGACFLERRGFATVRTVVISAVDPHRVDGDELFALELSLSADEPGEDEPRQLSFEEWRQDLFEGPDMTQEGSYAVVSAERPVAHAALAVDPSTRRGRNEGTATANEHRRRGLATLAKLTQLRWAAANGIDRVVTDNDERNAPMLAINRRLGYEPFTERHGFLKEL